MSAYPVPGLHPIDEYCYRSKAYCLRSFIPLMEKQGYGRIINVSSEFGTASEMSYPVDPG